MQNNETKRNESITTLLIRFYDENSRWMTPLLATMLLLFTVSLAGVIRVNLRVNLPIFPNWVIPAVTIFGVIVSGLGATFTKTVAAKFVRNIAVTFAVILTLRFLFH